MPLKAFCHLFLQLHLSVELSKSFQIEKEETGIIKLQLEEQMAIFFKTHIKNATSLKTKLTEIQKLNAIEVRFVIGEIDRELYEKFRPKYQKACFETEQELDKTVGL